MQLSHARSTTSEANGQNVLDQSRTKFLSDLVTYVIVIIFSLVILVPACGCSRPRLKRTARYSCSLRGGSPKTLNWKNFPESLTFLPFAQYFANTSLITFAAMIGQLVSSPMVAFAFARLRARKKEVLFILILATMMLPWQVTMIPLFLGYKMVGLVDTFVPLILPNFFGSAFFIFLLRQFFLTISPELGDAAKIDGCGYFQIFTRIYLPLSKPALATVAIFTFMSNWNDFMGPLIYLSKSENWTLTSVERFTGMYGTTAWEPAHGGFAHYRYALHTFVLLRPRYFIQGIVITDERINLCLQPPLLRFEMSRRRTASCML